MKATTTSLNLEVPCDSTLEIAVTPSRKKMGGKGYVPPAEATADEVTTIEPVPDEAETETIPDEAVVEPVTTKVSATKPAKSTTTKAAEPRTVA